MAVRKPKPAAFKKPEGNPVMCGNESMRHRIFYFSGSKFGLTPFAGSRIMAALPAVFFVPEI